ncbi:MAG: TlpA family protein disulfide reductase [Myxococcaceae bacterium]|nr:TlpA family protein disulfide reductase [Myxococcaceae bacterium]
MLSPWPPRHELVLVTFITTWCFPCLAELPVLQTLHEKYASKGLRVVLVGVDREGRRVLEPLAAQYAFPFPLVVADQALVSGQSLWGNVGPLPTRVLFGREGDVLLVANGGGVSPQEWLERVGKEVER